MATFDQPIIIVGAPRSGTTLLYRILQAQHGLCSLPNESDIIWSEFCHPSLRGWAYEGCKTEDINSVIIDNIRTKFARYAFKSTLWGRFSRVANIGFRKNRRVARFLRIGYQLISKLRSQANTPIRLVDKSVDVALRMPLVEAVFPDALYIYIQRNPRMTTRSMVRCWLDPHRFFTFDLPVPLRIPDYPYERWNFILPEGWREYVDKPLEQVAAFQCSSVHRELEKGLFGPDSEGRVLRLKLEDLVADPTVRLLELAEFVGLNSNNFLRRITGELPRINQQASLAGETLSPKEPLSPEAEHLIAPVRRTLGYSS